MREVGPHVVHEGSGAGAAVIAALGFVDDDGRLALGDDGVSDAYLVDDGTGRLVLDDTVTAGLQFFATPVRITATD